MIKYFPSFAGACVALLLLLTACQKADPSLGNLSTPSKPVINVVILGKDDTHPNGDGSGQVTVSTTSTNAFIYKVDFGDGQPPAVTNSNAVTYKYGHVGNKQFTITVAASGKGGLTSTDSTSIMLYRAFVPDPGLVTMLTGAGIKKWKVDKDAAGNLGLSDAASFAPATWWWTAGPNEKAGLGLYDDVYTFSSAGNVFTHTTNNDLFGQKQYLVDFDPSLSGSGDYTLTGPLAAAYTETFAYDGSPTTEFITFSNKGHMGMYFGVHRYQVLNRTDTTMTLRCLQSPGAWYVKIRSIP